MENHKYGRTLHNHEPTDGGSDVKPGALASDQTEEHQPEDVTEQLQHVQHQPEVAAPGFDDLDEEQGDNLVVEMSTKIFTIFREGPPSLQARSHSRIFKDIPLMEWRLGKGPIKGLFRTL